jgi:hypothetical protein
MRLTVILLTVSFLASCHSQIQIRTTNSTNDTMKSTPKIESSKKKITQFTSNQLEFFLDSLSKLSPNLWISKVVFATDSVFKNQKSIDTTLTEIDFDKLKKDCFKGNMDLSFVKAVFPDFKIDTSYYKKEIRNHILPITFFSFDKKRYDFKNFAVAPGYDNGFSWDCVVYFFNKNKLIGQHKIYHRYGLDLKYFKDKDDKTVIYYLQNYQSGSGIWWFNFNFYKYQDNKLIPILNEIENVNLQLPWNIRGWWLKSTIKEISPLKIKMVYYQELPDTSYEDRIRIIDDSTTVIYRWDASLNRLVGDYSDSKITKEQVLTYYLTDNELLFINSYYSVLKQDLSKTGSKERQFILNYLNLVKNHFSK